MKNGEENQFLSDKVQLLGVTSACRFFFLHFCGLQQRIIKQFFLINSVDFIEFARVEGILPAPESGHAIKIALDEAKKCIETGEEKTILFGLTGTGYFDMYAYAAYNDGTMSDYIPTDEELAVSIGNIPKL